MRLGLRSRLARAIALGGLVGLLGPPAAAGAVGAAGGAALAAAGGGPPCYGADRSDPAGDAQQLDAIVFSLHLDCQAFQWTFTVQTRDAWPDSELAYVAFRADVDGNPTTGCSGFDRLILGRFDTTTSPGTLVALEVETPSCDQLSWRAGPPVSISRATRTDLTLGFPNAYLGNPARFSWQASILGRSEATGDLMPDQGTIVEQNYPVGDACTATSSGQFLAEASPGVASRGAHSVAGVLSRARGIRSVHPLGGGIVRFGGDPSRAARALARAGLAATVAPEHRLRWADVPNDPQFPRQWALPAVRAPDAWSITHGSASVVVADVDSGVDATHPDLAGKLTGGYDAEANTPLAAGNTDTVGHGTEVAGVIAAATNNNFGLASLGWDTTVMPIKVGSSPTTGPVAAGIHWAVDHGARIVNLSLGGCADPIEADAVAYAQAHGALVVASAGNSANLGNPVSYPAAYPGVLAVGATGRDGTRAFYSETGPYLGMVAPGGSADGNAADDLALLEMGGGFGTGSGTSFAAPMVAAAAALVQARSPTLSAPDLAGVLKGTAIDLGPPGRDDQYGTGLLQAAAAVVAGGKLARLAGPTRFDTASAVSLDAFPGGATEVFVASGSGFADALATGPLSKPRPGPLLLTDPCSLPSVTANELSRLHPARVTIVGGESAICPAVLTAIQNQTGVVPTRVAGATRYDTAAALSRFGWPGTSATAYLASGVGFPDGLSGGPRAALDGAPLLLSDTCTLPAATSDELVRLHPAKVVVLGGTAAICDAVLTAVGSTTGAQVTRLSGPTRYATAAAVARDGWPSGALVAFVASGTAFPDALASGPGAIVAGGPVLLVDATACAATGPTLDATRALHPSRVVTVGGTTALCGDAAGQVAAAAG